MKAAHSTNAPAMAAALADITGASFLPGMKSSLVVVRQPGTMADVRWCVYNVAISLNARKQIMLLPTVGFWCQLSAAVGSAEPANTRLRYSTEGGRGLSAE
jgi:hypothetical protein